MLNSIKEGSILLKPQFLPLEVYNSTLNLFNNNKFYATYQPTEIFYGNRLQAYPCYQYVLKENENIIFEKLLSDYLDTPVDVLTIARKIITSEIQQSKCNTKYGYIHQDSHCDLAAVLPFDQTIDGGTAFFENIWDKYPDITVGAYPNRLVIYNSQRPHAPSHDFTFVERKVLAFMIKVK